jgi:hypothetical protein
VVHQAGVDRALRHRRELGGLRILRHAHPAGLANRTHAPRSVRAAAARENDADCRLVLILGQGGQKEIDGHPDAVPLRALAHDESPRVDGQVLTGGIGVDTVGLHRHAVFGLDDLHARALAQDVRHAALVGRFQVLDHHEGQSAVRGHGREELFQRLDSARRGADAHNENRRGIRSVAHDDAFLASVAG